MGGTGWISGKVSDASTLGPVAGIEVCAVGTSSGSFGCDTTDSQGEYEVAELATGSYKVEFWPPGPDPLNYVPQYYSGKSSWSEATAVHVVNGAGTSGIDAALAKGGWVEGRVTDAVSQAGLSEVFACAFPIDEEGFGRCAETDSLGDYTIHGLAPDSYEVEFFPEDGDHLFQVYEGKSNWFEATPVNVEADAGTGGVDAELARAGHIVGTVTDAASGAGIGFTLVCLVSSDGEEVESCGFTDGTGHYSFGGLPSGSYRVWFSPDGIEEEDDYIEQFYNGKSTLAQSELVTVTAPNTTSGIDAHLTSRKSPPSTSTATRSSSQPQSTPAPPSSPKPRKTHCRRGFRRLHVHGKTRCVRAHRHRGSHRHHH